MTLLLILLMSLLSLLSLLLLVLLLLLSAPLRRRRDLSSHSRPQPRGHAWQQHSPSVARAGA